MKKNIFAICVVAVGCTALTAQTKDTQTLVPLTERVNVQADSARVNQIIDDCWVAVGTKKPHAIQRDFTRMLIYRFSLHFICQLTVSKFSVIPLLGFDILLILNFSLHYFSFT